MSVEFQEPIITVLIDGEVVGDIRKVDGDYCFDHVVAEQNKPYHNKCALKCHDMRLIVNKLDLLNGANS